jgi:hypothetical protein
MRTIFTRITDRINYPNNNRIFGANSGDKFGPHSGSNTKFGPDSGKVFGHNSGNNLSLE